MPYRGAMGPRIACAAHAAAEAAGNCTRCHAPLCDPCTLYFAADPFCRSCIGSARRAWAVRIGGGVAAVLLTLTVGTAVMLSAIPSHVRAAPVMPHRILSCGVDRWLDEADHDVSAARYHAALHHLALSQRDCPHSARRDQLYALAYDGIGDRMGAIAAASRWVDSSNGALDACTLFVTLAHPEGELYLRSDPRCPVQQQ